MKNSLKLISILLVAIIFLSPSPMAAPETPKNDEPQLVLPRAEITAEFIEENAVSQTELRSEPKPEPKPAAYQEITDTITEEEIEILARLVFLEARNQPEEGQRAVVEVVFNRVLSDEFPDTIKEVVFAKNQFSPAHLIPHTTPTEEQYEIVQTVLTDTGTVLDRGVVFFSRGPYNDYLYDKIGEHYFCYSAKSYQNKRNVSPLQS